MATRLLRRLPGRATALLPLVLGLGLSVGVLAPATTATAVTAVPKISSFSPTSGAAGTAVTITGSNFTGATAVKFNGVASVFTVNSSSQITATVPAMPGSTGPITVTTPGGTATSSTGFTVVPAVLLSPATGPPTTTVQVSGTGFGVSEGVDLFFDTTDLALAGTGATGSFGPISVTVPGAASPGTHWISAQGRHSGLFAQAPFTVNTNWAQFRYSRKHKGTNPYENVLSPSNVSQIDQDWSFTTGAPVDSSAAVANGVVYVGSEDSKIYALNASTGAQLWSFTTTGLGVDSSPAVANGVVYVGSFDAKIHALNASTGAELWSFTTGFVSFSSPAVANGVVYVGSLDGKIHALNASTGAELWSFTTGNGVDSSPAVANGVVYAGSEDGKIYALNASTGAQLWSFTTGNRVESSPAVANGVVYAGSDDGKIYALNASTGAELWSFTTGSAVFSSPAVANGVVYVGSADSNLYAFDLAGGQAAVARPTRSSLHPDYSLHEQR